MIPTVNEVKRGLFKITGPDSLNLHDLECLHTAAGQALQAHYDTLVDQPPIPYPFDDIQTQEDVVHCNFTIVNGAPDCARCPRYKDDCKGSGEFND